LHAQLLESLELTALDELQKRLQPGDLLLPASLRLSETLEQTYQPAEDSQPADHLELSLRLEYQAQVVSGEDLRHLARAVLDTETGTGYLPLEDTLQVEQASEPQFSDGVYRWTLQARRQLQARLSEPQVIRLSMYLPPEQARSRLDSTLPLREPALIRLQPEWWPRLPILPFRIQVQNLGAAD
jgi:hypothetical protein